MRAFRSPRAASPSTTRSRQPRRTPSTSWWRVSRCCAGVGATFGATNTLYASVQARTREIGTLRALGFSQAAIASSFLIESAFTALLGFALGGVLAILSSAAIAALIGDVSTFTGGGAALVSLRVGAHDLIVGLALALAIGGIGALPPALRAARLRPIEALRKH